MNPYAPPASATRVQQRHPLARFEWLSCAAVLCGATCAVFVGLATHSTLWFAAAVFASLMLNLLQAATLEWLAQRPQPSDQNEAP